MPIDVHWMGAFVRAPAMKFSVRMFGRTSGATGQATNMSSGPLDQLVVAARDDRRHLRGDLAVALPEERDGERLRGVVEDGLEAVDLGVVVGDIAWDDRRIVDLQLAERVTDPDEIGHVLLGGLARSPVSISLTKRPSPNEREHRPALLDQDVVLRVAATEAEARTDRAQRVRHDGGRDLHDVRLAVDPAARVGEEVERLVALDEHPRAVEDLEGAQMQVVEIALR